MNKKTDIKILLTDKDENTRKILRSILEKEQDMDVIAEVRDYKTTKQFMSEFKPDVVVLDYAMKNMNGLESIQQTITVLPGVKVLVVSIHSDSRFVVRILHAGASGYLLKDRAYEELSNAIRTVVSDKTYISPGIAGISMEE